MAKTLFMQPAACRRNLPSRSRRSPLACVWIETGNPRQPLACVWIDPGVRIAADIQEASEPDGTADLSGCCHPLVRECA
jgi:hypothetical protein